MDYPEIDHPSEQVLIESAKRFISGFTPKQTFGYCDVCNQPFETDSDDTDYVYVYADWHEGTWRMTGHYCHEHRDQLDDRPLVEAVIKCELGDKLSNDFYPLYNPEVYQLNTSDGAVIRR